MNKVFELAVSDIARRICCAGSPKEREEIGEVVIGRAVCRLVDENPRVGINRRDIHGLQKLDGGLNERCE